ncbi:PEP-CTERM sorting domain-containing protein [Bythopirellula polymerisocia]|uniref:PEP-CTERM protein-sorting domain-containing protein n=1 Tax=Bythopirellula polymerisocia TaxID=2528003 RepID=A0A5C6CF97_9BACT|nr:PEP-CTERM sorting domain-containing protein [Bythopirellula polymerisocia]TWU22792.1 hypothetical protein Pla144_42530 [Bythopirellula polymerisocia]
MRVFSACLGLVTAIATMQIAGAAITSTTTHGAGGNDLNGSIAVGDAISGLISSIDDGNWHGATPSEPERLQALTDDAGPISNLTGLLNDFPGAGLPTKRLQYDLAGPTDIQKIQILTGNFGGDGRVFSTAVINVSTNNGGSFSPLGGFVPGLGANSAGYYQSDASGVVNSGQWQSTLLAISDDGGTPLALGITNLTIDLFAVDNTGGENRDPFDGINSYTGVDDGLTAAIASPLVWEIDVIPVPEPASCLLLLAGLGSTLLTRRNR